MNTTPPLFVSGGLIEQLEDGDLSGSSGGVVEGGDEEVVQLLAGVWAGIGHGLGKELHIFLPT